MSIELTLTGISEALQFVLEKGEALKFFNNGGRDMINQGDLGLTKSQAYHLLVIQKLEPKLISRLDKDFATLSIEGQVLKNVLADESYIATVTASLRTEGHNTPSDPQIFQRTMERLASPRPQLSLPDFMTALSDAAHQSRERTLPGNTPQQELLPAEVEEVGSKGKKTKVTTEA